MNAVIPQFGAQYAAGAEFQAAARAQRQDMPLDFRRHPMSVDVPIGARMSIKALFLLQRHRTPQPLRMRPQRVDSGAPISTLGGESRSEAAHPGQQPRQLGPERDLLLHALDGRGDQATLSCQPS